MAMRLCLRNKFVVLSMLVFPVLSTFLILAGSTSTGLDKTNVVIYAPVSSVYSTAVIDSLNSESAFDVYEETPQDIGTGGDYLTQFKKYANSNEANIFLYIPPDIGNLIQSGAPESVVVYDTGNDQKSTVFDSALSQTLTRIKTFDTLSGGDSSKLKTMLKEADVKTIKGISVSAFSGTGAQNSQKSDEFALVLGFFSWFAIWGSSYAITMIMRERELKVYKRILLTGVGYASYLSSKFIIGVMIGLIQVLLMLVSFKYIVHADYLVHLWQLGLLLLGFILIAITINLAIVSFCGKQQHVTLASIIIINVTAMISGSYWPFEVMPLWMRNLSYFTPQRWIVYTIGRIQVNDPNAILQYGVAVIGFMIFFSSIALLGFKFRSKLDV